MNPGEPPLAVDETEEIAGLITILHETEQRLELLTHGQVDTLTDRHGRTFILSRAQEQMRHVEAAKQAAILNALPAHIALLDPLGVIMSVNQAWRQFAETNAFQGVDAGVGLNYVRVAEYAIGHYSYEAHQTAAGIRSVLNGTAGSFSTEYSCHSPQQERWFLMTVTPLAPGLQHGVVVMHVDISERKQSEFRIKRLNRFYAVLSQINALIVRVRSREELFAGACRIAVEAGTFRMALAGTVQPDTLQITPVASEGVDEALMTAVRNLMAAGDSARNSLVARAVRDMKILVSNDLHNDPSVLLGGKYVEIGVRSMAVLPLIVSGQVIGVIGLYADECEFFHQEELKLLAELSDDVAFAIDHLDKQERLDYLAFYDDLTGLANRSLFLERVAQHMRVATSSGQRLAMSLIDLERFKNINDTFGRPAGDLLLRQVATWLVQKVGDASMLARVGVDQFAVVLPALTEPGDAARMLGTTIRAFLAHPFLLNDAVFRIAAKVGVAIFPEDGTDSVTLFTNAEAALKKAKSSGERYLFYTQKMTEKVAGRLTLENQLRQALERDEFVLHYQPKMNATSHKISGAEALIRWNDPNAGLVPPGRFIHVLEETGLIHDVGRWALRQVIADHLRWRDKGLAAVRISVNVSSLQLRNRAFIAEIEQDLGSDPRAAGALELEITESLIMEDIKHSIDSLDAVRALGLSIALDDFGTGFSSLSYLSKLPLDALKIDRSFVVDMTTGPRGLALVSTIITLAHSLGLKVVAEGVETEQQASLLRLLNCDDLQGFLFSKAVPYAEFEESFLH